MSNLSINGVEIFSSGEWNGDKYSDSDLDSLVQAFNETKEITKPYLKLGHGDKQQLLAKDELPAAGFIQKIYRQGKKVLADFVNIPEKIYQLIHKRAYNRVSSEIFVNFKSNGKTYPYALKAVALLGGETPAVHTLNDIMALGYMETNKTTTFTNSGGDGNTFTVDSGGETLSEVKFDSIKAFEMEVNKGQEDNQMTLEELTRQNAKLEAEIKSFQDEAASLEKDLQESEGKLKAIEAQAKEYKEKAETLEKKVVAIEKETLDKEIEAEVKGYKDTGKIVPAQAPFLIALLKNVKMNEETKSFSVENKEYADVKSLVKAFIDAHVDIKTDEEKSVRGSVSYSDKDLADKAKKYAEEHKVSYKEALIAVAPVPTKDEE